MNVTVQAVTVPQEQRVTFIDNFNMRVDRYREWIERPTFQATVNGIPWTVAQTEQALRDARACSCGTCACCRIRGTVRKLNSNRAQA